MASLICKLMGVVFVAVGIWGFVQGDHVLMFTVNTAHNAVHLISGLAALACGFAGEKPARGFSLVFGAVYGLVAVLGFLSVKVCVDQLALNAADNYLHAGIAAAFLLAGLAPASKAAQTA